MMKKLAKYKIMGCIVFLFALFTVKYFYPDEIRNAIEIFLVLFCCLIIIMEPVNRLFSFISVCIVSAICIVIWEINYVFMFLPPVIILLMVRITDKKYQLVKAIGAGIFVVVQWIMMIKFKRVNFKWMPNSDQKTIVIISLLLFAVGVFTFAINQYKKDGFFKERKKLRKKKTLSKNDKIRVSKLVYNELGIIQQVLIVILYLNLFLCSFPNFFLDSFKCTQIALCFFAECINLLAVIKIAASTEAAAISKIKKIKLWFLDDYEEQNA